MEINWLGKLTAGILLIVFTLTAVILIIGHWPNKMPPIGQGDGAWYKCKLFNMELIEKKDSTEYNLKSDSISLVSKSIAALSVSIDTLTMNMQNVTDTGSKAKESRKLVENKKAEISKLENTRLGLYSSLEKLTPGKKIHLNTLILILVGLMGFLGNMVHISSSFTSFVGNGTFKRSWILWYFVKPFTAAGLAILIYFVIRAGFFNYASDASSVSIYGVLSLAALAGLFTDNATLKLKEIFDVVFKPKDERKDKLEGDELVVTSISPEKIPPVIESTLVLLGKNLDKANIKIAFDGTIVTPASKATDKLQLKYTPTTAATTAAKTVLLITDKDGKSLYTKNITIGN